MKWKVCSGSFILVECPDPETAKSKLVALLKEHDIEFSFSKRSKFGNLKAGSVL